MFDGNAVTVAGNAAGMTATLDLDGNSDTIGSLTLGGATTTSGAAVTSGAGTLSMKSARTSSRVSPVRSVR